MLTSKIINVVGEEVHTLLVSRLAPYSEFSTEDSQILALFRESKTEPQVVTIMTIIGGPYAGSQWAHLDQACLEELREVYSCLQGEAWYEYPNASRIDLKGKLLEPL